MIEGYIILNEGSGVKRIIKVGTYNCIDENDNWIVLYNCNDNSRTEYVVHRKYLFCSWEDAVNYLENEVQYE